MKITHKTIWIKGGLLTIPYPCDIYIYNDHKCTSDTDNQITSDEILNCIANWNPSRESISVKESVYCVREYSGIS